MKRCFIIGFLLFATTIILAQKPMVIEASSFSMAIKKGLLSQKTNHPAPRIIIKKNIVCDVDYEFKKGTQIELAAGVQLVIQTDKKLILDSCYLHGKKHLWRGILVEKQGVVIIKNSRIQDVLYGVELQDKATVIVQNSTFKNNYIDIYSISM